MENIRWNAGSARHAGIAVEYVLRDADRPRRTLERGRDRRRCGIPISASCRRSVHLLLLLI
jgi:hypothetical protein